MNLQQLRYAVAVAERGGFTRAAAAEHIAQPSLSQAVRALETELGIELFHRVGRHVVVSAAGRAFLEPARLVLRDVETVRSSVAEVVGLAAGHLDLVALATLAVDPLAAIVGAFRTAHPQVTVHIGEPEDTAAVAAMVRTGRSEVGVTELPAGGEGFVEVRLATQELVAVRPPGSPRRRRLAVAELAGVPLVATPPGTSTRRLVDLAFSAAGVAPTIAVEISQREAVLPLVLAGAGTSFLPRALAVEAARRGAAVVGLDPPLFRTVGLVHREGPLSPAARAFLSLAAPRRATRRGNAR